MSGPCLGGPGRAEHAAAPGSGLSARGRPPSSAISPTSARGAQVVLAMIPALRCPAGPARQKTQPCAELQSCRASDLAAALHQAHFRMGQVAATPLPPPRHTNAEAGGAYKKKAGNASNRRVPVTCPDSPRDRHARQPAAQDIRQHPIFRGQHPIFRVATHDFSGTVPTRMHSDALAGCTCGSCPKKLEPGGDGGPGLEAA